MKKIHDAMGEYFCQKCCTVTLSGSIICHRCEGRMENFRPAKHGRLLVSPANSWSQIQGKWNEHPIFEEVSERLYEQRCCGAAAHINEFIRELLSRVEKKDGHE
jgi:hypothetical protein